MNRCQMKDRDMKLKQIESEWERNMSMIEKLHKIIMGKLYDSFGIVVFFAVLVAIAKDFFLLMEQQQQWHQALLLSQHQRTNERKKTNKCGRW